MKQKKHLIILGGRGLVGSRFIDFARTDFELASPLSNQCDVTNPKSIDKLGKYKGNNAALVNFSAYTDVSKAELERGKEDGQVYKINVLGAENIANTCKKYGFKLVHISTDYIFDGQNGPYTENDTPMTSLDQGTWYGWTKKLAEDRVREVLGDAVLIVRIALPYRAKYDRKKDFVANIKERLQQHNLYPMFDDQFITPTFIDDLAVALVDLIRKDKTGTYHIATPISISPRTAAKTIAAIFSIDQSIATISLNEFLTAKKDDPYAHVRYAKNTSLATEKITDFLADHHAHLHTFEQSLRVMVDQLAVPIVDKSRVAITGATGLLGMGLLKTAPKVYALYPTYFKNDALQELYGHKLMRLDITNALDVAIFFEHVKPNVIIHAASIGNVDYCEQHPDEADLVNVIGTKNIIDACKKYDTKLIFTSTNAIYDGKQAPYNEEAKPNPVNYYGKTKVRSEQDIVDSGLDYIITRLILMYGWNHPAERANPVTWLLDKLAKGEQVKLVNDTYTNPLYNIQAAEVLWQLIEKNKTGFYQIAGGQRINRYDFGLKTAEVFGYDKKLISPVSSDYFKGIAKRMPDTTFDTTKIKQELGIKPVTISDGLLVMRDAKFNFD